MATAATRNRSDSKKAGKVATSTQNRNSRKLPEPRQLNEGAIVRSYLAAIGEKRRPGRPIDANRLEKRLAAIGEELNGNPDALRRLALEQEKLDILKKSKKLEALASGKNRAAELEPKFVEVAKVYAERKKISYSAWRAMNVPASVLAAAGISRR